METPIIAKALSGSNKLIIVRDDYCVGTLKIEQGLRKNGPIEEMNRATIVSCWGGFDCNYLKDIENKNYKALFNTMLSSFKSFMKIDLSKFEKVSVWHGNSVDELLLVRFIAKRMDRPFYELDISEFPGDDNGRAAIPWNMPEEAYAKEVLLSEERINELREDWDRLAESDTGLHTIDKNGYLINTTFEPYMIIIDEFLKTQKGTVPINRIRGQLMHDIVFHSCDFVEKVVDHYFNNR